MSIEAIKSIQIIRIKSTAGRLIHQIDGLTSKNAKLIAVTQHSQLRVQ